MNAAYISMGSLALQTVVFVISLSVASAEIKSDIAVLKTQISYLQEQQREIKADMKGETK